MGFLRFMKSWASSFRMWPWKDQGNANEAQPVAQYGDPTCVGFARRSVPPVGSIRFGLMSDNIDESVGTLPKRRGVIVWCLIIIEALGSVESVRAVVFGVKFPPGVPPSLANAATDMNWLQIPITLAGGVLSALMAWYFYKMSRKLFAIAYGKLGLAIVATILQIILNAQLRNWVAGTGLWPLLISPIICIAVIAYVHHLDGNNRLED